MKTNNFLSCLSFAMNYTYVCKFKRLFFDLRKSVCYQTNEITDHYFQKTSHGVHWKGCNFGFLSKAKQLL